MSLANSVKFCCRILWAGGHDTRDGIREMLEGPSLNDDVMGHLTGDRVGDA